MNTAVMFSSATAEWPTPQSFFDELDREFNFALDVCATDANAKCPLYYTQERDGLTQNWAADVRHALYYQDIYGAHVAWMNPPYGRGMIKWVHKAHEESLKGLTVVCLLPARTDTKLWHKYVWDTEQHRPRPGVEVRFVAGRLKFGDGKNPAPFPSVVVIFRPPN